MRYLGIYFFVILCFSFLCCIFMTWYDVVFTLLPATFLAWHQTFCRLNVYISRKKKKNIFGQNVISVMVCVIQPKTKFPHGHEKRLTSYAHYYSS